LPAVEQAAASGKNLTTIHITHQTHQPRLVGER
jgi:hypothetical protein